MGMGMIPGVLNSGKGESSFLFHALDDILTAVQRHSQ